MEGLLRGRVAAHELLTVAFIGGSIFNGFILSEVENGVLIAFLLILQVAMAIGTWVASETRARHLEAEHDRGRAETVFMISKMLAPLTEELARVSLLPKPERRSEWVGLRNLLLAAATGLAPPDARGRACYFAHRVDASGSRVMLHDMSVGRQVSAKAEFRAGTDVGDAALAMVDADDALFCRDVEDESQVPAGWEATRRGEYRTFISVPVTSGNEVHGMLTLDAQPAGSLTTEDVGMMRVLGNLLGTARQITQ